VAPCFKNLLRLEAGYPALRCHNLEEGHDDDDDMPTPTGYSPHTQQPIWPTAHTAHSQHCSHTALPPGQKTNPRRRADPTQTVYAHPFRRAQTQVRRKGT